MRKEFCLTEQEFEDLVKACRPVRYIVVGGSAPRSPQENANDAWCLLGTKHGFDGMTAQPVEGKSERYFTAEVVDGKAKA